MAKGNFDVTKLEQPVLEEVVFKALLNRNRDKAPSRMVFQWIFVVLLGLFKDDVIGFLRETKIFVCGRQYFFAFPPFLVLFGNFCICHAYLGVHLF